MILESLINQIYIDTPISIDHDGLRVSAAFLPMIPHHDKFGNT